MPDKRGRYPFSLMKLASLETKGSVPFKLLNGFIYVEADGFESDEDLKYWVDLCEQFVRSLPPKK